MLRVLLVAANASVKWGGEAVLPIHVFRGLRAAGHEAWLCTGAETKQELEALLGADVRFVRFVDDTRMHAAMRAVEARAPRWVGSHPLYFAGVLSTQLKLRGVVEALVRELEIDVVHQPTPVSPKAPSVLTGLPVPLVIGPMNGGMTYAPGFDFLESPVQRTARAATRSFAGLANWVAPGKRKAACLLVANRRTADALPSVVRGRVEELAENGIDPALWTAHDEEPPPAGPFEILFLGRLERWKGAEWLIEAVVRARHRIPCRLRIVGPDVAGERRRLEALAARLGAAQAVELEGYAPQARCAELLRRSHVLALPSLFECGGAVVLEAMASARAVIAVRWGGPAEYLDDDCGVLLEPRGPEALVADLERAIVELGSDRERCLRLGRNGRRKVLAQYAWPAKIARLVEIYEAVLARSGRRAASAAYRLARIPSAAARVHTFGMLDSAGRNDIGPTASVGERDRSPTAPASGRALRRSRG